MGRIHFFEFGDQKWFPAIFRNFETDFLQFLSNNTPMYKPVVPVLSELLVSQNQKTIIDLCSGSGGGLLYLNKELSKVHENLKFVMTDLYPNIMSLEASCKKAPNFSFEKEAVDARNVKDSLKGLRTMFLSFHHFKPEDARIILQNAVNTGADIAIFEGQDRSFKSLLAMIFSPVALLLLSPFIRPFSIWRILFTYLIPLMPIFVLWDGIVSSLRTYSVKEMKNIVDNLENKEIFEWKIGKVKSGPGNLLYLVGRSKIRH